MAWQKFTRALLQSKTAPLDDRLSKPYGVRAPGMIRLSLHRSNRVQASGGALIEKNIRNRKPDHISTGLGLRLLN
jgi:hypothetical protein